MPYHRRPRRGRTALVRSCRHASAGAERGAGVSARVALDELSDATVGSYRIESRGLDASAPDGLDDR